jgi:hypothetical protein
MFAATRYRITQILSELKMNLQKISLNAWLMVVLLFSLTSTAMAQRDDGAYQILQARYGTAESNVDVTQTLKDLARRDVTFRMGNRSFGIDPHPNRVKTLRIYARDHRGDVRVFEYREGSLVDGNLFRGWRGGNWGREGDYHGSWDDRAGRDYDRNNHVDDGEFLILNARYGTAESHVDVTDRLRELAQSDRSFRMGNRTFGIDPHPNRVKMLKIYTRGPRGEVRTFEYREGSVVDGALFKGWSRGNWGNRNERAGWNDEFAVPGERRASRVQSRYDDQQVNSQLNIISAQYGTESRRVDVSAALRMIVREGRIEMRVENDTVGQVDPAPGMVKTLWLTYSVNGGRSQSMRVQERDWLRLPR